MGNTYCCAYQDKPGEDILLDKKTINIGFKHNRQGTGQIESIHSSHPSDTNEAEDYADVNKFVHLNGIGCDPSQVIDFDSLKKEKRKLFSEQMQTLNQENGMPEGSPQKVIRNKQYEEQLLQRSAQKKKMQSDQENGSGGASKGRQASTFRTTPDRAKLLGSNLPVANNNRAMSAASSPNRQSQIYQKLKEGNYTYEQTKQMLLSRQDDFKRKKRSDKYSPHRKSKRDSNKLQSMIHNNSRYINFPHGSHMQKSQSLVNDKGVDRNKIYALRSSDPIVIPSRIMDIPAQLARKFDYMDDNEIIFEGELMKYKPGMNHMYMSRWCQVTKSHFLYFAEGVPYASYLGRPLAVVPLSQIDSVRRVCVDVPERKAKYAGLKNYQFEIFLRREGEPRWSSKVLNRDSEEKSYTSPLKHSEIQKSAKKMNELDVSEIPETSPQRDKVAESYNIQVLEGSSSKNKKKHESDQNLHKLNYRGQKKNLLAVPGEKGQDLNASMHSNQSRHRSHSQFTPSKSTGPDGVYQHYDTNQHHLMPKPSPRKLSKAREDSPDYKKSSFLEPSHVDGESEKHTVDKQRRFINKKILREIQRHVKDENQQKHLIAMIEESLAKPLAAEEIFVRNPSSWIKSLSSNFTWTNRELEWYFAEDRFLFAALNEDECDRWVAIMNWLLARLEDEEMDASKIHLYDQSKEIGDFQNESLRKSKEQIQETPTIKFNNQESHNNNEERPSQRSNSKQELGSHTPVNIQVQDTDQQ